MVNDIKKIQSIFLALHENDNGVKRDQFDRYVPQKDDFWVHQPIVSEYLYAKGFRPEYPGGKKFAVCISHDVDRLFEKQWGLKTIINQQSRALVKLKFSLFRSNFRNIRREIHPNNELNRWLALEKNYGVKASYYFLSLTKGEEDFNYHPSEVKEELLKIIRGGHEVGLHGGHLAFNDPDKINSEKKILEDASGKKMKGYRNHYLRFEISSSWKAMMRAGFLYDTTFGHAAETGYRNGMAHPFQFTDEKNKTHPFYVLPLQVMDATLENYLKLDREESFHLIQKHVQEVIRLNGVFTFLWHNNKSSDVQVELFESVLKYLNTLNPWYTTGEEIIEYYMTKGYFDQINQILEIGK